MEPEVLGDLHLEPEQHLRQQCQRLPHRALPQPPRRVHLRLLLPQPPSLLPLLPQAGSFNLAGPRVVQVLGVRVLVAQAVGLFQVGRYFRELTRSFL